MLFRAVGNYCGLDLEDLNDLASAIEIRRALDILGFIVVERNSLPTARSLIGKSEYKRRSTFSDAPERVDCSSFIKWIYGQLGIWMPRYAVQQFQSGINVNESELRELDLVFTRGANPIYLTDPGCMVGHVGLCTGSETIIHAANTRRGVVEDDLLSFVGNDLVGCRRIVTKSFVTLRIPTTRVVETSEDIRVMLIRNHKLLEAS